MDVRNCKICKNLFNYQGSPICPACNKKMEDKFAKVREYIRDNPNVPMSKVSEDTEVPIQQLKKWVRQERLQFSKDSGVKIDCESCGKPILTGRYCNECKSRMTNSFTGLYSEPAAQKAKKKDASAKMRFLE
ncbi:MAG: flagellar protein [Eubacteriales bacterium]|nr:flagellar protein [Eubacteriales bacterium]